MSANYKMVALQIGDLIKYEKTEKEINRAAQSVFNFNMMEIRISDSITSVRAKAFANWVLTLAVQKNALEDKNNKLLLFLDVLLNGNFKNEIDTILTNANILSETSDFDQRNYHELVIKHSKRLFRQNNYFHAVFEAAKVYNRYVQEKSYSDKDGQDLMLNVLSSKGCLKLNTGRTQTELNVQEGVKFLSAGLMQALRNPTSHEPALDWPIGKQDCLDMLSFISYLFKQIDNAQCVV